MRIFNWQNFFDTLWKIFLHFLLEILEHFFERTFLGSFFEILFFYRNLRKYFWQIFLRHFFDRISQLDILFFRNSRLFFKRLLRNNFFDKFLTEFWTEILTIFWDSFWRMILWQIFLFYRIFLTLDRFFWQKFSLDIFKSIFRKKKIWKFFGTNSRTIFF